MPRHAGTIKMTYAAHNQASLANVCTKIESITRLLRSTIDVMKTGDVSTIEVNYQKEMVRGLKGLEDFATSASRSVRDQMIAAGFYAAPAKKKAPKKTRKKR